MAFTVRYRSLGTVLFFILSFLPQCVLFGQEGEDASQTGIAIADLGVDFWVPAGRYKDRSSRTAIGTSIGLIVPTRNRNFFVGGRFSYARHDSFRSDYDDVDAFGFPRRVFERAANHHFNLDAVGYYMPDWSTWFQPYVMAFGGLRRVHTRVVIRDAPFGDQLNSFTYEGTIMVQVGTGIGAKIKIKRLIIDAGVSYAETTPGSHLVRKKDWRTITPVFATDVFDNFRISQQWLVYRLGVSFILETSHR
jgi:hypothetical protein